MRTRRDQIAPNALLVPRKESLADLADRVMTLIYGPHAETVLKHRLMHQPQAGDPSQLVVGDDAEVIMLVKSQISYALRAGQIVLGIDLDTSAFEPRADPYVDLKEFRLVDNTSAFDFPAEWVIAPRFWDEPDANAAISWADSTVTVATAFIYEGAVELEIQPPFKQWHPLSRQFANLPTKLSAKAYVANPDAALRKFFEFGPLPTPKDADEYRSLISNFMKEATAAAWRHLALTGAGSNFNQRELVRAMETYLKSRNLFDGDEYRPSEGALLAVAGKIHKQFQLSGEAAAAEPVYVSSTPVSDATKASRNPRKRQFKRIPIRTPKA